jgi:hypothetical protein
MVIFFHKGLKGLSFSSQQFFLRSQENKSRNAFIYYPKSDVFLFQNNEQSLSTMEDRNIINCHNEISDSESESEVVVHAWNICTRERLRQEDCKFQASLSYMKPYPKKERKERKGRRGRRLGEKVKGKKGEREREGERGKRKRGKERARKGMEGKGSSKVLAMAHTEKNLPFFIFLCGTWNVRCKGKLLL